MEFIIPLRIISLRNDGFHLFINVQINGNSCLMVLDTGASLTVIDSARVSDITTRDLRAGKTPAAGIGTSEMETCIAVIDELKLGNCTITDTEVVVISLEHVNAGYKANDLPAIDGAIGSDILVKYGAVIDYRKSELRLIV